MEYSSFLLLEDKQYQKVQDQIAGQMELIEGLHLEKEQWLIIDQMLSLYAKSGAVYGRAAYQQGYKECAALLRAINLIKDS